MLRSLLASHLHALRQKTTSAHRKQSISLSPVKRASVCLCLSSGCRTHTCAAVWSTWESRDVPCQLCLNTTGERKEKPHWTRARKADTNPSSRALALRGQRGSFCSQRRAKKGTCLAREEGHGEPADSPSPVRTRCPEARQVTAPLPPLGVALPWGARSPYLSHGHRQGCRGQLNREQGPARGTRGRSRTPRVDVGRGAGVAWWRTSRRLTGLVGPQGLGEAEREAVSAVSRAWGPGVGQAGCCPPARVSFTCCLAQVTRSADTWPHSSLGAAAKVFLT